MKNSGKYLNLCVDFFGESGYDSYLINEVFNGAVNNTNAEFTVKKQSDGYYSLMYGNSYITVSGETEGSVFVFANDETADAAHFKFVRNKNGGYHIVSKLNDNLCLENTTDAVGDGEFLTLRNINEDNNKQIWYFEDAVAKDTMPIISEDKIYSIKNYSNGVYIYPVEKTENSLLNISNDETKAGRFRFERYGETDYYYIHIVDCDYVLCYNSSGSNFYLAEKDTSSQEQLFEIILKSENAVGVSIYSYFIRPKVDSTMHLSTMLGLGFTTVSMSARTYWFFEEIMYSSSSAQYTEDGYRLMSTTDNASGLTTSYTYDTYGRVTALNVGGRVTNTAYDSRDRVTSVSSSGTNIGYTYDDNRLKSINVDGAFNYNFQYDIYGNNTAINVNNSLLAEYSYTGSSGLMSKMTYGNSDEIGYSYDEDYRITQKTYVDKDLSGNVLETKNVTYEYDLFGNVYETYDGFTGVTSRYYYDLLGRPTSMSKDNGISKTVNYDEFNRVQGYTIDTPLGKVNTSVDYNNLGVVNSTVNTLRGSQNKISYTYDPLSRLNTRKLEAVNKTSQYSYLKGENGQDTMLVQTFNNGTDTYSYTYDSFGNITSVRKNGVLLESYVYDSKNQLIQLTDSVTTYYYNYDDRGNIKEYWEYDGGDMGGTTLGRYSYDTEWDDKLIYFNGTTIIYDNIGNPNNWRNNMSFTWSYGRRLAGVTKGSDSYTYTYDADGLRTSKTVNGVKTDYYWVDGILQGQKTGSEDILFLYDENGTAYGMLVYNGSTTQYYYYLFNLQGDVVGIMDSTGATVVTYTYDAWGKLKGISGTLASTIGVKNPIRYRGYYYDTETGFYYLQSRYYDPQVCRFINGDNRISGVGGEILGYNQFAYSFNDPVNLIDYTGNWPGSIKSAVKWVATKVDKVVNSIKAKAQNCELAFSIGQSLNFQYGYQIIGGALGISAHMNGDILIQGAVSSSFSTSMGFGISSQTSNGVDFVPNFDLNENSTYAALNATAPIPNTPISGDGSLVFKQNYSKDGKNMYPSFLINAGAAYPAVTNTDLSLSFGGECSYEIYTFNIYDIWDDAYTKIMEW